MAYRGRRFVFHGAFKTKRRAKRAPHDFILKRRIKGRTRYVAMKRRKR